MEDNNEEETVKKAQATTEERTYTKEQILKSRNYRHQRDIINALLVNGRSYSLKDVDSMIEKFMKGECK